MRVFFALWPDDATRKALVAFQKPLRNGRKLVAENLHLTLHYIGDVDNADCLITKARRINFAAAAFSVSQYGFFRQARVLWVGPDQWPDALTTLAADCRQVAEECGYIPKRERFRPHVTLARKLKSQPTLPDFNALLWCYSRFCLVESVSTPEGVVYKKLGIFDSQ